MSERQQIEAVVLCDDHQFISAASRSDKNYVASWVTVNIDVVTETSMVHGMSNVGGATVWQQQAVGNL